MAPDSNTSVFRFFDLPPELRLRIYNPDEGVQPNIAEVCQEARVEALKLYYRCNKFEACYCRVHNEDDDRSMLVRWLEAIGPDNRRNLRQPIEIFAMSEPGEGDPCMEGEGRACEKLTALGAVIEKIQDGMHKVTFPIQSSSQ
ncbi:hypothetical protein EJ03DRAFT_371730 [Teratosphaeria nubilosa]|uniref:Uncharacterized protein n=1 Tax=Teratosphaeria nubilosa TaxID=161662 RepID=A0A6G1LJR6_9PEZI|nr:hypothetical protein EJ03DRAFT_371730 [Teratosphaeria nubilosa]